ncbi:MAG: hypothetical protein JWO25_2856 [Alphaproteobacteria bacterium]|nr:hypothetical protein [Alphaproteobacteria bacterium]MDB5721031.1 hypothetical protein [Alphaproteobacteria bacterium]
MPVKEDLLGVASTPRLVRSRFSIELSLSVADDRGLWAAAAEKGLAVPGATLEDVYELIGPREDPDLGGCLAMLTAPSAIAGCELHDFEVIELKGSGVKPAANDFAATRATLDASA